MDRIWQWAWDRYGAKYSWVVCAISFPIAFPVYLLLSFIIVAFEKSSRYIESAGVTVVAVLVMVYALVLPGLGAWRLAHRWAAGQEVDRASALEATYAWSRKGTARALGVVAVVAGVLAVVVGVIAGATGSRLGQYGILGAIFGPACHLIGVHSLAEASLRPVRVALAGGKGIGDSLPRSRPTFATWTNLSMLGVVFAFAVSGAMLTAVFDRANQIPALWVVIGFGLTLGFGVPITVFASFSPVLKPIEDLAKGTKRVAAGDYSQRLPVVQDDDLGVLAASFNRMQAGLVERQRLQGAFGT